MRAESESRNLRREKVIKGVSSPRFPAGKLRKTNLPEGANSRLWRKEMKTKIFSIALIITLGAASLAAQTGGGYDLTHNVISGGGGEMQSVGGNFKVDGTAGQRLAGTTSMGGVYNLHGGFWFNQEFAPTAALVTVMGRVSNPSGGVVQRVRIVLVDTTSGTARSAKTNPFGYFQFDNVEVGRFYIVRAENSNFTFTPESHAFNLFEGRDDLNFTAVGINQ